jgi:hypothetical protein
MSKEFNTAIKDFNEAKKRKRIARVLTYTALSMAIIFALLIVLFGA